MTVPFILTPKAGIFATLCSLFFSLFEEIIYSLPKRSSLTDRTHPQPPPRWISFLSYVKCNKPIISKIRVCVVPDGTNMFQEAVECLLCLQAVVYLRKKEEREWVRERERKSHSECVFLKTNETSVVCPSAPPRVERWPHQSAQLAAHNLMAHATTHHDVFWQRRSAQTHIVTQHGIFTMEQFVNDPPSR